MYRSATPNAYRESAVMTASPVQLVVMLYDGANRFLQRALILHGQDSKIEAGVAIGRAQAIVEELLATIDIERGGDIAPQLQGIYVFCLSQMATAHLKQDPAPLHEVMRLLGELRDSWQQIAAQQN
ncbi:MAG: flagellar export chaperone FliS [Solirubrobacteraceae bacterium]|nr:flagellar export chaperone FliS [Solirubrobacteraceae bacterium]